MTRNARRLTVIEPPTLADLLSNLPEAPRTTTASVLIFSSTESMLNRVGNHLTKRPRCEVHIGKFPGGLTALRVRSPDEPMDRAEIASTIAGEEYAASLGWTAPQHFIWVGFGDGAQRVGDLIEQFGDRNALIHLRRFEDNELQHEAIMIWTATQADMTAVRLRLLIPLPA